MLWRRIFDKSDVAVRREVLLGLQPDNPMTNLIEKKCCSECVEYADTQIPGVQAEACNNYDCPCHSAPQRQSIEKKLQEFEEKFVNLLTMYIVDDEERPDRYKDRKEEVKVFLCTALIERGEEVRREGS